MKRNLMLATLVALSLLLLLVWPRNGRHASKPENSDEPKQALAVGDSSGQSDRTAMKTEPPPMVAAPVPVVTNQSNGFEQFVRES